MTAAVSTRIAMPSEIEPAEMRVFDQRKQGTMGMPVDDDERLGPARREVFRRGRPELVPVRDDEGESLDLLLDHFGNGMANVESIRVAPHCTHRCDGPKVVE
jgi:hypothetical protein